MATPSKCLLTLTTPYSRSALVSVKDVPADLLIRELAKYLRENVPQVKPSDWALFVKTGPNKDRPPMQDDWWYIRPPPF
nr:40S ribosomal protein S19 [Vulcanisaeta sp. JCM 16159]